VFNKLKENIQIKSKIVSRNLTRLDRTVSWFFKGSKPGGGRGL
jgi:hypothetical protein